MDQQSKVSLPPFVNEDDVISFFKDKIGEGAYYNVYNLLVDLSLMIYPLINKTEDDYRLKRIKSLVSKIRRYINKHSFNHEGDLHKQFDEMWRYSFKLPYAKSVIRIIEPEVKLSSGGRFLLPNSKINSSVNDKHPMQTEKYIDNDATIADLNLLFLDSVSTLIDEHRIFWVYNSLLKIEKWKNVYEFLGSLSCVIYNQFIYSHLNRKYIRYKLLGAILTRVSIIHDNYPDEIYGYGTEDYFSTLFINEKIKSFEIIWHKHYSISLIIRLLETFTTKLVINEKGDILLDKHNTMHLDDKEVQENVIVPHELLSLYEDADSFILYEKRIIEVYNLQNVRDSWINIYDFLASLFYVILIQLSFVKDNKKTLRYVMLRNLAIIASDIKKKYRSILKLDDREECINELRKILQALYGVKVVKRLARDFSIISSIDDQGNIMKGVLDEISLLDDEISEGVENSMTDDNSDVVVLRILKW